MAGFSPGGTRNPIIVRRRISSFSNTWISCWTVAINLSGSCSTTARSQSSLQCSLVSPRKVSPPNWDLASLYIRAIVPPNRFLAPKSSEAGTWAHRTDWCGDRPQGKVCNLFLQVPSVALPHTGFHVFHCSQSVSNITYWRRRLWFPAAVEFPTDIWP